MNRLCIGVTVLALLVTASACKGSSTAPAANDFSISVTSANENIFLGATEQMTATASDGRVLSGTWGSDNQAVATVNSTGLVAAVSSGLANIFFVADGRQGTKPIRALPHFSGTFQGNYEVTSCTETGEMAAVDVCRNAPKGTLVPYTFIFTQTGPVLGGRVLILGVDAVPPFSATIGAGGDVTVNGTVSPGGGLIVETTWELAQPTAGNISGTIAQRWTAPGLLTGEANITGTISSIAKTASVGE